METQDPVAAIIVLGWVSVGVLLLIVIICVAPGRGSLSLNHFIGLRVPALMSDEESWRVGHAAAILPAIASLVLAFVFSVVGIVFVFAYWGAIAALIVGLIWIVVRASGAARRPRL